MSNEPWKRKTEELRGALDETKEVISQNIEDLIKRGESIDSLRKKTETLVTTSASFKKKAMKLARPELKEPGCCSCIKPLINSFSLFCANVSKSMGECCGESEENTPLTDGDRIIHELINVF